MKFLELKKTGYKASLPSTFDKICSCFLVKNNRYINPTLLLSFNLGFISHFLKRHKMALGMNLAKRTISFGTKRILSPKHMDFDSTDVNGNTPKTDKIFGNEYRSERSLLETLPLEILIKILCGVDHDDLKTLFHVSTTIQNAAIIAKNCHFEFSTPKKIPAFRCSLDLEEFPSTDFDEIEVPNAPKRHRSRLTRRFSSSIRVSLFASSPSDDR